MTSKKTKPKTEIFYILAENENSAVEAISDGSLCFYSIKELTDYFKHCTVAAPEGMVYEIEATPKYKMVSSLNLKKV